MNYGPLIFLGAFFALAASWFGLILTPNAQVGRLAQTETLIVNSPYPPRRPGLAAQGLDVYRANGCAYCHSQQVGQTGVLGDVLLSQAGTNQPALVAALRTVRTNLTEAEATQIVATLPQTVLRTSSRQQADAAVKALNFNGAKVELWISPTGPDISRGWGKRHTVADDFLYDYPVMPGSQRVGPDLADVGARSPDANWHLMHLYAPRAKVPDSLMPPYRFLFEKRKIERAPSPEALALPSELAPPAGYEIVPKTEAKSLVAYLLSLNTDAPLTNSPFSVAAPPPTPATNAPASAEAASTNAPATNAPPK